MSHRLTSVSMMVFAIAVSLAAASPSEEKLYRVEATVTPVAPGHYRVNIMVRNRDGSMVAAPQLEVQGGTQAGVTSTEGNRHIRMEISLNDKGNGPLTLEVREGDRIIESQTIFLIVGKPSRGEDRITLNLKDAELGDVIRTLSSLTGVRIDSDVPLEGKITVNLAGVPWGRVLSQILAENDLAWRWEGEAIRIKRAEPSARVGGDIKAPRVLTRVDPEYTAEAKQNRVQGIVIVEIVLDEAGNVLDAYTLKSLPYGLDQAAIDAVRQWTFAPATRDGQPVPVKFTLTVNFKLDEEQKPPTN